MSPQAYGTLFRKRTERGVLFGATYVTVCVMCKALAMFSLWLERENLYFVAYLASAG